jgi:hypothetical protein
LLVDAAASCAWTLTADANWMMLGRTSGQGPAQIRFGIGPNPNSTPRMLTLTINPGGRQAIVTQPGRNDCTPRITPNGITFEPGGGTATITLALGATCTIPAPPQSNVSWLRVQAQGSFTVVADPNSGPAREGVISAGGQPLVSVTQRGATQTPGTRFIPIAPCRIADTRFGSGKSGLFGPPFLESQRDFPIALAGCGIPATARMYSLNVTAVPFGALGYLTIWPQGEPRPLVSTLNSPAGAIVANASLVRAGVGGGVSVFVSEPGDVILDVNGYFVDSSDTAALAFYPMRPCRLMDTRSTTMGDGLGTPSMPAGSSLRTVPVPRSRCATPPGAAAYSLNVTAVPSGSLHYLSLFPTGRPQPLVSTLNSFEGRVVSNAAIVPAGDAGSIEVFTQTIGGTADVILDINGYFAPAAAGALSLYPVAPCRNLDTRSSVPLHANSSVLALDIIGTCGVPASALAFVVNATVVPQGPLGFLNLFPQGDPTQTSTLNSWDGRITANTAIVPAGTGGRIGAVARVEGDARTHLILDVFGYFAP